MPHADYLVTILFTDDVADLEPSRDVDMQSMYRVHIFERLPCGTGPM